MACGCKKGGVRGGGGALLRPTTTARSVGGGISAGPTPTQLRAQQTQTPTPPLNANGLSAERRKTQAIRRDAIRKSFNKG